MKRRLGIIVLLLLSLVLNGCVGVKTPSYVVSGSVMDKETGEPVSGVEILLNGTTADITKDDGTWTISGVKKGAKVTAEKPGWSFWAMGEGQDVVRGDKQDIRFLGVQTEKPFAVDGVVHDALGNPVSGVAITFEQTDNGSKSTVVTGPDGRFVRSNLSGVLKVTPQKTDWTFEPPYATVYEDTSLYFKGVQTTYTVSGYVEDEQGQPIERAVVTFVDSLNQVSTVLTNANGFFVKSGLRGEYKVSASKPGFSFTPAVEVVTDARELLFTGKGTLYALTGRVVTPSGEPIENAVITFVDEDQTTVTILSDSNGNFVQTGLSGTVLVQVSKPGYVFEPSTQTVTGATSLVFTGRGTSYTVSGFVQDDAGVPIANAVITFTFVDADNATTAVLSDSEGKFTQSGLSGNVKVTASKPGFKFSPEAHQISGATFLVFRGEGTTYTVSGRVQTEQGEPIANAIVKFVSEDGNEIQTLSAADGYFTQAGLSGEVTVTASKEGFDFSEEYEVKGATFLVFTGKGNIYTVTGRVLTSKDEPIENALVSFKLNDGRVMRVLSNRDGYFAQSGLSGEVEVSISKPSFTFKPQKRTVNAATELLFTGEGEIYTVTGEVLDGERGVEKAVVTFQWGEGDGQVTLETLTDSSGRFSQTGLSGPVDVSVTKDGYDPAAKKATREQNHLVFNLSPSKYSVTVEAKRTNGAGIEGANITVWKGGTIIRTAQTTNDGTWTFNDLVGAVTIQVAKEGWVFNPTQAEVDRAASVVFIGSQAGYTVSGIVQSTEGEPIQGATLEFAFQDGSGRKLYAQSDERGEFSQSGLSGTVDVTVKKPGYTFTPPTETVEGPTQLSFVGQAETYTINGRVLRADSLSGVDGVTVTARRGDKIVASATTENGFFALQNLTGEVTVRAERQGWEFDPPQITVDWTDQDTEILFLGCEQGYTISGRVEETGTGNPIPYAVITFVQDGETIREILTNEYGFFSESGFTGTVQVQASKPGFAFAGEGYTVTGPRELLFSGTGTTYSVSGKVIDQESYKGLSGALITFELLDESGNPTGLEIDVQSDEDGQFSLSGLSGEYTVTASLPGFTFSQIHRVSKETHGLTFQGTRETYRVIGKVVLAGREDEGIGAVEVTFEGDHGLTRSTVTTAQGNFQLSDLSGPGWVTAAKEGWDFEPQKGHYVQGETTGLRFFGSYKVDGYVLTESGEPVEGAEVTFMADGAVLPEFTATTNAQGYFSVSGLTTTYSIEVSKAGFAFEDGPEVSGPTSVEVRGTYEVTVVVKDVNGEAIPGATIYVKRNGITYDIVTTSDGKMGYTLKGLEGPVEIEVLKTGWQFTPAVSIDSSWAGRAIIFEGRDLTEPTEPTYTVSGTVTAGDNHPVANVTVVFEGNDVRVEATTDSEGKFTLVGVRGIGVIKASKAGYAFDAYPVDVESNMTDIELKGTYMISGKVIDKDGKGVGSVKIVVEEVPAKYTFSDSSGQFTLAGLEGAVTLVPVKDDVAFDPEFVEVTGPDDSPVFKLLDQTVPTYTVSGRVVDEYGDPIPEVQVQALRPANGNGSSGDDNGGTESENDNGTNVVAETWTDLDGHYTLEGLQGTVMIKLTKSGHTFTEKTVSAGTSNLDFLGTLEGYTVSGRVFDDDGSQLAGVLVTAVNDKGETWTTTTDSSGAYKLNGLKRTNTIRAEKTGYVFEQVHSVSDSTAGLHFYGRPDLQSYKAAGKIWLTGTANPVSGVEVRITFIDSSRSPFKVVTNSEGEWEVDGLAGKVMIVPQKPGWVFDPASRGITGEDLYVNFSGTYGSGD